MAGTVTFRWDSSVAIDRARSAGHRALDRLKADAHGVWNQVAPVGNDAREPSLANPEGHKPGTLRGSWFAYVKDEAGGLWLIIGASARYAIFVELGTSRMAPRAPLRTTAGTVWPLLDQYLREEMAA